MTLDTWGPVDNLFPALYDALQSNWGDAPSRMVNADGPDGSFYNWSSPKSNQLPEWEVHTGWYKLNTGQRQYVESCFAGQTLQQCLERITFSFTIDGATRAATHQIVRTRLGAGFMQHGGRDNDWRHRPWIMPETIRRACAAESTNMREGEVEEGSGRELNHCISDWKPIDRYLQLYDPHGNDGRGNFLDFAIGDYLQQGRYLYSALVDAGIPWEDARRLLWIGTSTYIHADYNYLALKTLCEKRLEFVMDWEINCIVQLMRREVVMKCPPIFAKYLMSGSDRAGKAMMAGMESWTPDGKYPNPFERCECGHAKDNHLGIVLNDCEVCEREYHVACDGYRPVDSLPREHRPEQNPFWVLHPDSMAGGPIKWIATNGTYPHEEIR